MPDNSFTIGAIVNVGQLAAGMNQAGQITKEALDKMLVDFSAASSASSRAVAKISDATRAAALSVDSSWQRIAAAQLAASAAAKEVSGATYLARAAAEGDTTATSLLAAAKQRAADASLQLKEAEEAVGAATASTAEENIQARLTTDMLTGNFARADQALIRFASHTSMIGPIIEGAFVPFAVVAFAEIIGRAVEKAYELFQNVVLLRGAIEALEKADASAAEKAASLNYEYEESLARRLKAQGKLNEATAEFTKASADKPLGLIKIDEKNFKQFSSDFISFLSAVHTASDAPAVIARIQAEAASASKQLAEAKKFRDELLATPATGDVTVDTSAAAGNEIVLKRQEKLITDLTEKVSLLHNAMSQVQSETGIASENALEQKAEDDKKEQKPKKDTRLEDWRSELQAKRDAEDGFHEMSRADEAKFWESKLELAKGSSRLYAEVYHQIREDERAAQKDSLRDEVSSVQERLAATKEGSAERVAILQEEIGHMKSAGAGGTEEYKRAQVELTAAVRAYSEEQGKAAIEAERRKVDATRKGSEDRVAAERSVLTELQLLGLRETSAYTEQLNRVTEAVRTVAAQRIQLQELDIDQARIMGQSRVQIERQNVEAQYDLHRINAQQRIALLKQIEADEYEIEKQALEKKLALEQGKGPDTSVVELQRIQNQIENLTRAHNNRLAALNTDGVKESQKAYDNFFSLVDSGFQASVNGWLQGTQTFQRAMMGTWDSFAMAAIRSLEKVGMAFVQHKLEELMIHTGTEQAKTAATAAGTASRGSMEDLALVKHLARSVAEVAIHAAKEIAKTSATVAGIIARESMEIAAHLRAALRYAAEAAMGAFKAVMTNVPFPADLILAPVAAAGAFAGVMAFASAKDGMVSAEEQMAFIHRNEMVLPAPLSQGFQHIIGHMSAAPAAAAQGADGGAASAGVTHNYGGVNISAFDSKGVADMIRRNQREFTRAAAGIVRNGWRPR